jgi:hypothetical protein
MDLLESVGENSDVNFGMKEFPSAKEITIWNKLRSTGLLIDKKQKYKPQVLTEETLDDIGARFEHTPRKSLKGLAQKTGVPKSSARRATLTEEEDSVAGFSKTQLPPTLNEYFYRLCPTASGTELSAVVFGQHVHLILIFAFFSLLALFEGQTLKQ